MALWHVTAPKNAKKTVERNTPYRSTILSLKSYANCKAHNPKNIKQKPKVLKSSTYRSCNNFCTKNILLATSVWYNFDQYNFSLQVWFLFKFVLLNLSTSPNTSVKIFYHLPIYIPLLLLYYIIYKLSIINSNNNIIILVVDDGTSVYYYYYYYIFLTIQYWLLYLFINFHYTSCYKYLFFLLRSILFLINLNYYYIVCHSKFVVIILLRCTELILMHMGIHVSHKLSIV
mgnify:CR=1 FL=1